MNFNKFTSLAICILWLTFEESNTRTIKSINRPHVIFILADDLGWNDVGFHGDVEISTPNIDALAYSGVILNNYYVQPLCTPSRGAIMTGIIVGKWHLGDYRKDYTPTFRGFDSHYGYWEGMIEYYSHTMALNDSCNGYDFRRNMEVEYGGVGTYATDLFTEEGVKIINEHNPSVPLFLYLPHLATHVATFSENGVPLQAPDEVIEKFSYIEDENRRVFAAMLWKLDESIGKVVEALKDRDMLKDSIIVFSADNGGSSGGYERSGASNWPLRGTKNSMWEGGIRGSSFIWSSLMKNPGRVSTEMMHVSDWLPTLFNAIGGDVSVLHPTDGMNVWESLQGESSSPRTEFLVNIDPFINGASIRDNKWKLLFNPSGIGEQYDGWFGPSGRNSSSNSNPFKEKENYLTNIQNSPSGKAVKELMPNIFENIETRLKNAEVLCTDVPKNATASCNDINNPCLFNILSDPCEYYDVSKLYPSIVEELLKCI
ncbi:Arylsulfatase B [Armadillidium nasatum]|uniref:Arylsulfatase B n=1 Tax=Armadillidium nasatum TaxID=96803 RepID=A0A5N5SJ32_9CRUS|nr:Arylsulfatase B [Armadillidium nasatum]